MDVLFGIPITRGKRATIVRVYKRNLIIPASVQLISVDFVNYSIMLYTECTITLDETEKFSNQFNLV